MRVFVAFVFIFVVAASLIIEDCFGFQQQQLQQKQKKVGCTNDNVSLRMGLFDGFIKSMESGYAGGDDSPYSKMKADEETKRAELQKRKTDARKQRGYSNFKDYNPKTQKTFAKLKYDDQDDTTTKEDAVSKWAKEAQAKKQASGFKFPWDK